jgi:hypothetical protein
MCATPQCPASLAVDVMDNQAKALISVCPVSVFRVLVSKLPRSPVGLCEGFGADGGQNPAISSSSEVRLTCPMTPQMGQLYFTLLMMLLALGGKTIRHTC